MIRDYQKRAVELVAAQDASGRARASFAYYGSHAIGETWAIVPISQHRDSDTIEQSNWRVITADLVERFGDDVDAGGRASHWAVGWVDHCEVRMLDSDGKITPAGIAVFEWIDRLADYPVACEEDQSELEMEVEAEDWESYGRKDYMRAIRARFGCDYLEVPDDQLDTWFYSEAAREIEVVDRDYDGSPIFEVEKAAELLEWEDLLTFDTEGELTAAWHARNAELPPYLRSARAPWEGDRVGVSMPGEGVMT